ncbi:hypothetical protein PoB_004901400 [Plakobranchus ocellatus]|uniref:Uncharacterized protein n=1 Tax=Plakobranchus ocellatus TaxID=259542 RepID=A0AAV4BUN9_9GAST|nr:hypothetical protein PoB_004901400 [Plakobranchus ocellatus]
METLTISCSSSSSSRGGGGGSGAHPSLNGPQQDDLRLSCPPPGQGAGGGARTRDRRVLASLRADSLYSVPPTNPFFGHLEMKGEEKKNMNEAVLLASVQYSEGGQ